MIADTFYSEILSNLGGPSIELLPLQMAGGGRLCHSRPASLTKAPFKVPLLCTDHIVQRLSVGTWDQLSAHANHQPADTPAASGHQDHFVSSSTENNMQVAAGILKPNTVFGKMCAVQHC